MIHPQKFRRSDSAAAILGRIATRQFGRVVSAWNSFRQRNREDAGSFAIGAVTNVGIVVLDRLAVEAGWGIGRVTLLTNSHLHSSLEGDFFNARTMHDCHLVC